MIIKELLDLILTFLTNLLSGVTPIPALPSKLIEVVTSAIEYLLLGIDILAMFLGEPCVKFMGVCLDLIIFANFVYFNITVIEWFLKKIPFINYH